MPLDDLDEAINHCKEKEDCTECGKEHQQLRKWLEELKERREDEIKVVVIDSINVK